MKQRKQTPRVRSANDNVPARAGAENMERGSGASHLYVQDAQKHEPEPIQAIRARATWTPTRVSTNLPQNMPVLPEEIALIQGFMGDLVSRIFANDNEPV